MNLRQLAASLRLSQTTVSRALNGYPEVGAATRRRVLEAARAANYQPNARARRLATGRAMTVGHVISIRQQSEMINPIFADFITGAGEVYAREGYDLVLSIVPEADEAKTFRTWAAQGSVDGVMLQAPQRQDDRIALLSELGIPFLVHGRSETGRGPDGRRDYAWLDVANADGFQAATGHLLGLGHRRIALVNGPETLDFAARRRRGFERAFEAAGLSADPTLMFQDVMTENYGYRVAVEALDKNGKTDGPPSAFLTASIMSALGVQRAVIERGLTLGRDVSLVTYDDELSYLQNQPGPGGGLRAFSAVRSSVRAAGRRCAELLLEQIATPTAEKPQELWTPQFVSGVSSGPPQA
ncbi:MAG: LacI family DNA-binding transcriptional regulator [Pseudomonadota bacterium]